MVGSSIVAAGVGTRQRAQALQICGQRAQALQMLWMVACLWGILCDICLHGLLRFDVRRLVFARTGQTYRATKMCKMGLSGQWLESSFFLKTSHKTWDQVLGRNEIFFGQKTWDRS
jgi:hypothetical protein